MKRIVMAVVISAMMYAAAAVTFTSCTWMEDWLETQQDDKSDEPQIPLDDVLSVEELVTGDFAGDTVWVRGFIVGGLASDGTIDFGCESEVLGTVVILADDADCTEPDDCMALQLTKKAHKEALAVSEKAIRDKILHQEIYVQGKATTYKKLPALTNICAYQLE